MGSGCGKRCGTYREIVLTKLDSLSVAVIARNGEECFVDGLIGEKLGLDCRHRYCIEGNIVVKINVVRRCGKRLNINGTKIHSVGEGSQFAAPIKTLTQ